MTNPVLLALAGLLLCACVLINWWAITCLRKTIEDLKEGVRHNKKISEFQRLDIAELRAKVLHPDPKPLDKF